MNGRLPVRTPHALLRQRPPARFLTRSRHAVHARGSFAASFARVTFASLGTLCSLRVLAGKLRGDVRSGNTTLTPYGGLRWRSGGVLVAFAWLLGYTCV